MTKLREAESERKDTLPLALKMFERAMSQRMQEDSRL